MSFPTRKIGESDVTALGYGAMGISAFYGATQTDEDRFQVLDAVYANGCTFWDTADIYNDSEVLIGKWFKRNPGKRDKIFLATKFGIDYSRKDGKRSTGTPEYARARLVQSLEKLGVDHIDLYYLHRVDLDTPIETTIGAMAEFVKSGKVKYIGVSECSAATLRRAHAVHPIAAVQVEYSPFTLDIEDPKIGLLAACRELGVKVVAYSPLGRGLLTGQYKSPDDFEEGDFRRGVPRYSAENFPNILKIVDGLKHIASRHNATAGQVALAWLLGQGDDIIPIPGTKKIKYLEENLGAIKVKLSQEELAEVRQVAVAADAANGNRYPDSSMSAILGDTPNLP